MEEIHSLYKWINEDYGELFACKKQIISLPAAGQGFTVTQPLTEMSTRNIKIIMFLE
jgi:hypothetical protein